MEQMEGLLLLFVAAALLATAARRVGAPYPVFLALGGVALAFIDGAPSFTIAPDVALALFVAPAALALPPSFPYRDLIVLMAFAVVLGTLIIQGLTLKPLLRALDLHDEDPVGREVTEARERALNAALASFANDNTLAAKIARMELSMHFGGDQTEGAAFHARSALIKFVPVPFKRRATRFSPCRRAARSGTTRFIASRKSLTGSKWEAEVAHDGSAFFGRFTGR
jgi:hypothetical protein